ncbi:pilus assembly protein CpaE [Mycetocola zhujimingii]|uniref:Pilus assembly protein CpaE n=1 Tax=Mycetocola zhujimingii TaxID=2079792 RepID=A0A2U1TCD5_9MICO|nr:pilus assembly protein CpaE [Mycetocola zhujimingii]AWB87590.1 pilus assembly protein CpaE [Mycetocola zhujimingii]PWC06544.1 pilus assembly protein CpaE [Mycetocola zhujimingii]
MTVTTTSPELAQQLRDAGLGWIPESGDQFCLDAAEFDGEVFTVSDMTIEPHDYDSGTILGFNGTTEWALDSVALENTLWLPREDQLRELLGSTFSFLLRVDDMYAVEIDRGGETLRFDAATVPDAYALAVLGVLSTQTA